ncbi:hypothetical protein TNCT_478311, partial [Trichonephila clavata]
LAYHNDAILQAQHGKPFPKRKGKKNEFLVTFHFLNRYRSIYRARWPVKTESICELRETDVFQHGSYQKQLQRQKRRKKHGRIITIICGRGKHVKKRRTPINKNRDDLEEQFHAW